MSTETISPGGDVYHPEWVAFEKGLGSRPALSDDINELIAGFDQMGRDLAKQWPALDIPLTITEETIEPENIRVRIYKTRDSSDDLPLMLYFHGGGFISGDLETEDPHCQILAAKTPCIVASVEYPLAPKVNVDGIIQSGLRAIEWSRSHSPPLSTSSTLLLAGGSSGATLALELTYHFTMQQPQPHQPPITGLILIMPTCSPAALTPYTGPFADTHTSAQDKAEGAPILDRKAQLNMITIPKMSPVSPAHFPLLAPTLQRFPRTYIVTAEHDPCRDDGKVLAKRLAADGSNGEVLEVCYWGMPHWFHWFPGLSMAHTMMERTVNGVRFVLGEVGREEAGGEV